MEKFLITALLTICLFGQAQAQNNLINFANLRIGSMVTIPMMRQKLKGMGFQHIDLPVKTGPDKLSIQAFTHPRRFTNKTHVQLGMACESDSKFKRCRVEGILALAAGKWQSQFTLTQAQIHLWWTKILGSAVPTRQRSQLFRCTVIKKRNDQVIVIIHNKRTKKPQDARWYRYKPNGNIPPRAC